GPVVSVAGGKLTTYRRTAERVVDRAVEAGGLRPAGPANSGFQGLAGGDAEEQARARSSCQRLADERLEGRLWATYGKNAAAVIERMIREPGSVEPVAGLADLTLAELEYSLGEEMVMSHDDLLRRRSRAAMFDSLRAVAAAQEVASQLAEHLGWDARQTAAEVERFVERTETELGIAKGAGD
ncbi:MAG: glycerol-3-phosphate dehydrogenase C-terminal domain-containing protein, partial [Candidatus Binatia bacterium]